MPYRPVVVTVYRFFRCPPEAPRASQCFFIFHLQHSSTLSAFCSPPAATSYKPKPKANRPGVVAWGSEDADTRSPRVKVETLGARVKGPRAFRRVKRPRVENISSSLALGKNLRTIRHHYFSHLIFFSWWRKIT